MTWGAQHLRPRAGRMLLIAAAGIALVASAAIATEPPHGAVAERSAERVTTEWPRRLRVIAGGDILTESPVRAAAARIAPPDARFDFGPLLATDGLLHWADLAICHLELPIGEPGGPYGLAGRSPFGGNRLLSPYELAPAVAGVGFDRCSTASNHSYDVGFGGVVSTLAALDGVGVTHAGTARSAAEGAPRVFEVRDVQVAHLSYTTYSNTVLPSNDWAVSSARDPSDVIVDIESVRAAGAEVVIVSLHLSREMQTGPTLDDRMFAATIAAHADIDLIVHHGPHVIQPFELVAGVPVFWSLGNFISGMGIPGTGRYEDHRTLDGLLAVATFVEQPDGSFDVDAHAVAICTDPVSREVRHARSAIDDPALTETERRRAAACLARTERLVPVG